MNEEGPTTALAPMTITFQVFNDDGELRAIETISHALNGLLPAEAGRVLRYVNDRWGDS